LYHHGWSDEKGGVFVKSLSPDGSDITITYNGLLDKCGASQVFLHGGFGDPTHWKSVEDFRMQRTPEGWKKTLNMEDNQLTFCFRDTADNWDNNYGYNWTYKLF